MSNTKPGNQAAYYHQHPPKCIATFLVESAQFDNLKFDGHGSSGIYPDGLAANPNTVFAIKCQCGSGTHKIVGESENQEIWRHENLVVTERYFLECCFCHSRHLLFDRYLHGYDAETSQLEGLSLSEIIGSDQSLPNKEKVTCRCSDCSNTTFEVFARFEYPPDLFDEPLFQGREQEFFRGLQESENVTLVPRSICLWILNVPNSKTATQHSVHNKLVSFVERMLELHKRSPRLPQEKESLQWEIEPAADGRIDRLVYELYGLSEEEIKIVES